MLDVPSSRVDARTAVAMTDVAAIESFAADSLLNNESANFSLEMVTEESDD